eukprot:SAG31_NODE_47597_length_233_cov_18.985075_1_plen_45_part_01
MSGLARESFRAYSRPITETGDDHNGQSRPATVAREWMNGSMSDKM